LIYKEHYKNIFFLYIIYCLFFKNGETKIQVKIQPNKESELNLSKEDSLLMHSRTPNNEIEEYVNGDLCLYGVSTKPHKKTLINSHNNIAYL